MYQALYRKWRPRSFDDVVGQGHITETLKRQVQAGRLTHAYLFTGTRGTGKTTCAKILARAVNCQNPQQGNPCNQCPACTGIENGSILDVVELDAASNNRVDDVRAMLEEAAYTPATVKKRVYIIDEVHMLSPQAFNALLQILEEPPEHLMFILATTELHKVPATIKSRCQQFAFKRIQSGEIAGRLSYVAQQEGIELTQEGAALIARLADGGMRDALSLLDQCVGAGERVDQDRVFQVLGLAGNLQMVAMLEEIAEGNTAGALQRLNELYTGGKEMAALAGELSALIRDLLVSKSAPKGGGGLLTGGYDSATLQRLAQLFDVPKLVHMLSLVQKTAGELVHSANRRTDMELCLVMLCDPTLDASTQALVTRVAKLEQMISSGQVSVVPSRETPVQQTKQKTSAETVAPSPQPQKAKNQEPIDVPPWEVSPNQSNSAPVERARENALQGKTEEKPVVQAIAPAEPVVEAPPSSEPVSVSPPASGGGQGWPGWNVVCGQLKGVLSTGDYMFFSMPGMLTGRWDGTAVTLWATNQFVADLVSKPDISGAIAQTVAHHLGHRVAVHVQVGTAPAEAPVVAQASSSVTTGQPDALDAFLAAGHSNVIEE